MKKQHQIDNNFIGGAPLLTMGVDTTADKDFVQADLDDNLTACVVSGSSEVGMGNSGDRLFGKVVWVSKEEFQPGTTIPALCDVQVRGVVRFKYNPNYLPGLGEGVCVDGAGKVVTMYRSSDPTGQGIALYEDSEECDVWLG